jgi:ribosome-binding protein aMBF1 (putative translation factor)
MHHNGYARRPDIFTDMVQMTPAELRAALKVLGWSRKELGRRTRSHKNSVNRWVNGDSVPGPVEAYVMLAIEVRKLAALTNPLPRQ